MRFAFLSRVTVFAGSIGLAAAILAAADPDVRRAFALANRDRPFRVGDRVTWVHAEDPARDVWTVRSVSPAPFSSVSLRRADDAAVVPAREVRLVAE